MRTWAWGAAGMVALAVAMGACNNPTFSTGGVGAFTGVGGGTGAHTASGASTTTTHVLTTGTGGGFTTTSSSVASTSGFTSSGFTSSHASSGGFTSSGFTSSHAASSSSTTGGVGTCANPSTISNCGTCANQTTCATCASTVDAAGVTAFNNLTNCLFCTVCYNTCQSATLGGCSGPPAFTDACDTGTPGMAACDSCQQCAATATCSSEFSACNAVPQCTDLLTNYGPTCSPLPP